MRTKIWCMVVGLVALALLPRDGALGAEQDDKSAIERTKADQLAFQAGIEKGRPFLRSADGIFQIEFTGRLQLDYHGTEADARTLTGVGLNDRFLIRRARLGVEGKFFRWMEFVVEGDFTEDINLKDGYLQFAFLPELRLRAGQFKEPFSLEELTSSRFLDFVERSLVNAIAPSRDVGVMLSGSLFRGVLSYAAGVFNGAGENAADNNDEKDVAARVVLTPFRGSENRWLRDLQLAGNATFGDQDLSRSPQGRTAARTGNRFRFFAPHTTQGDRTRLGADAAWFIGPASLKFEYDVQRDARARLGAGGTDLDDVTTTGWYVSGTFVLTGETKLPSGAVIPRRPFQPFVKSMGAGAWEVGARYAELDFTSDDALDFADASLTAITGGGRTAENKAQAVTLGVNWYLNERVRLMLNGTRYRFDNPLGTPFSCVRTCASTNPTNLRPAADTFWEFLSRLEVWF